MTVVPDFSQYVEYVTEDAPGGTKHIHFVAPHQHALDTLLTLQALQEGYAHAATLGRVPTLSAAELDALKLSVPYHADVVANEIVSSDPATIVERLEWVRSRPEWGVGVQCVATIVYYNPADANLYRCVQSHKAQVDWRPDLPGLAALWVKFYTEEWPVWVQPTGAHDAYNIGDKVTFNGGHYISKINANVWSPAVYPAGWSYEGAA